MTGQTLTIASMVGFISLCGIATRNGILLLDHYLHLVKYEGETWSPRDDRSRGQERLAPVLMTALTAGIGLVPLAMAAGQPGKEILYPVATVIIGGLISSTLLEFLVRPALFWTIGRKAGQRIVEEHHAEIELKEIETAEYDGASWPPSHGGSRAAAGDCLIRGRNSMMRSLLRCAASWRSWFPGLRVGLRVEDPGRQDAESRPPIPKATATTTARTRRASSPCRPA